MISSRSEDRYIKILGADARHEEGDDEIYVADPTSFESWRQALIDHHGHDMSVEQEKNLRAKVDKVIDAYEQERAALRKLSEKIDEIPGYSFGRALRTSMYAENGAPLFFTK